MKSFYIFIFTLITALCKHPYLYQISTRPWLYELSKTYGIVITRLTEIPLEEFDTLAENGVDIVWMMGIWELGQYGLEFDRGNTYDSVLPDYTTEDIIGSPFAITNYTCNPEIGSDSDIEWLRIELNIRGIKLMLDFVPNHSAVDCQLSYTDPDLYIIAPEGTYDEDRYDERGIAFGSDRDHHPWRDVIQWNYWNNKTVELMIENLKKVITLADGVRCDVAYLVLNDVFEITWNDEITAYGYQRPEQEFWTLAIAEARKINKNALFLAESYSEELSQKLIECGFNYVYDKVLLDNLILSADNVRDYLKSKTSSFWQHTAHFVENHDEQRIVYMTEGNKDKAMAAGTIGATVGGMIFINHGQWEGKYYKLDVHLRRATYEKEDMTVKSYYMKLNKILKEPAFHGSNFYYIEHMTGLRRKDFVAYIREEGDNHYLVVVNYSDKPGCANVPIYNIKGFRYCLVYEALNDEEFVKTVKEVKSGMEVCLDPWESQIYQYNY